MRGVSPVVASILLIFITLSVAAYFLLFSRKITLTLTGETSKMAEKSLEEIAGGVEILDVSFIKPPEYGLVLYLPFDEKWGKNFKDLSGAGNDGVFYGEELNNGTLKDANTGNADGNTPPQWVKGKFGYALSFDGVDDYVDCGRSDVFNFRDKDFTVIAWVYARSFANLVPTIVGKYRNSLDDSGWAIFEYNNRLRFRIVTDVSLYTAELPIETEKWYFVVMRRSGNTLTCWLNEQKVGITFAGNISPNNYRVIIGNDEDLHSSHNWQGIIDEVRIYERALTEEEIRAIYENNTFIREGLVAYWRFDEGKGNTTYDTHHIVYETNPEGSVSGNALSFDGVNDYIEIPHSPELDITDEITVAAWVWQGEGGAFAGSTRTISSAGVNAKWDWKTGRDGKFIFVIEHTDGTQTYDEVSIPLKTWVHLVGTFKNGQFRMYKNGELIIDKTPTSTGIKSYADCRIRIGVETAGDAFNGTIDEVRIYNRALSREEIINLYAPLQLSLLNPEDKEVNISGAFLTLTGEEYHCSGKLIENKTFFGNPKIPPRGTSVIKISLASFGCKSPPTGKTYKLCIYLGGKESCTYFNYVT